MDLDDFFKMLSNSEIRNDMIINIFAGISFCFVSIMVLGQIGKLINSFF